MTANTVELAPAINSGIESEYINGVGKLTGRLLILFNLGNSSAHFHEKISSVRACLDFSASQLLRRLRNIEPLPE